MFNFGIVSTVWYVLVMFNITKTYHTVETIPKLNITKTYHTVETIPKLNITKTYRPKYTNYTILIFKYDMLLYFLMILDDYLLA
jgi:hypothetical protein